MRILVVEDEKRLASALVQILKEAKYMADAVYDGEDAVEYAMSGIYDVIILDVMLPKKSGFTVATELRASGLATPVLMLTAKDALGDKISGLDSGADDYMTKPFSPEELLARVRALSRRRTEFVPNESGFGDISFDASTSMLRCGEKEIHLNIKEAQIMRLLMERPSMILSKDEMITKVWGYDSDAGDGNVEAYISFLRRKLNFVASRVTITAVKKQGYRLEANDA